jgi:hypothetical protein
METIFHSAVNTKRLTHLLFNSHRANGGKSNIDKFIRVAPKLMHKFAETHDLNSFMALSPNVVEALIVCNVEFINFSKQFFKWNIYNPHHEYKLVGPSDAKRYVRNNELSAADMTTLNFEDPQPIYLLPSVQRDTRIPDRQLALHNRHYDRSNDGVIGRSLENFISGYDMSGLYQVVDSVKKDPYS